MKRTIAIALGLAVTVSACTAGNSAPPRPRQTTSSSPSPSRLGPPNAILGRNGLISTLPDTCPTDKASLPSELSGAHLLDGYEVPIANAQSCEWSILSSSHAHILSYMFRKLESSAQARKEFDFRKRTTGSGDDDCRRTKSDVEKISNLGEEAFAVPCRIMKEQITEATPEDRVYEVGGLELDFRVRNVIAWFFWVGAEYPTAVSTKNPHWLRGGKQLSYDQALPQTIKVAKSTLAHFPVT